MKRMLFALTLLAGLCTGCQHNLQEPYVESMEATYKAVMLDVEKGLYKPDDLSQATLDKWKKANEDARKVIDSDKAGE